MSWASCFRTILKYSDFLACKNNFSANLNCFFMLTPEEIKNKIKDLAVRDGYIDSIFNYCDRWCERCAFTSKCRNFAFEKEDPPPDGPELWAYLHNIFEATFLMLEEMMRERGFDLDKLSDIEEDTKSDPKNHSLSIFVRETVFKIHDWLKKNDLHYKIRDQVNPDIHLLEKLSRYKDSIEVIYWYNFFISAKITRAVSGLLKNDELSEYDMNGSAKIALVSIDRLIASWIVVLNENPECEDEILDILVSLAEIRKRTEMTFPEARKFIRPGFDE